MTICISWGSIVTRLFQLIKERAGGNFFWGGGGLGKANNYRISFVYFFSLRRAVDGMLIFFMDTHYRSLQLLILLLALLAQTLF